MDIRWRRVASGALAALPLLHATASAAETAAAASAVTVASFQRIEQALMDAVATCAEASRGDNSSAIMPKTRTLRTPRGDDVEDVESVIVPSPRRI